MIGEKMNQPPPRRLRRLPRPAGGRSRPGPVLPPDPAEAEHPYVGRIVEHIERVSAAARLSPYTVLADWLGMIEATLRRYGLNAKAVYFTGRPAPDPPEVAAIFRRARERYVQAARTYPAAYRAMQEGFIATFNLLQESAEAGLGFYGAQLDYTPDVVGQVFLACVKPGPAWWPYFPPWRATLEAAREAFADAADLIMERILAAGLKYCQAVAWPIRPEPGEHFEEWFEAMLPYADPLLVGPAAISSSAAMLAAAAQFPDWAVTRGLVQFYAPNPEPLLDRMISINASLYGLNGYDLELINIANELIAHHNQRVEAAQAGPVRVNLPSPLDEAPPLPPVPQEDPLALAIHPNARCSHPTFADLFRKRKEGRPDG
jgi:hypothetical protein